MRMSVLGSVAFALFVALVARLWFLQVLNETEYLDLAEDNTTDLIIEPAPRGRILDVNGRILVDNRTSIFVTVDKGELLETSSVDRAAMFLRIAKELSATGRLTKVAELEKKYESNLYGPFGVVPLVGDISEELQVYLAEHSADFPGIGTRIEIVRDYPFGDVAAHLLGYVGTLNPEELARVRSRPTDKPYLADDEIGKSGIELFYEDALRGSPGSYKVVVDKFNTVLEIFDEVPAQAGSDIRLTIDVDLQKLAEDALREQLAYVREFGTPQTDIETGEDIPTKAPAGSVVVTDPNSGEVRAMASYPTYDPAIFSGDGISQADFEELTDPRNHLPLINRVIQGTYPPGSTFKTITAYAALDTGMLGPRGVLNPGAEWQDTGFYTLDPCLGECLFRNAGGQAYGPVDLPLALTYSSDVYFYNLAAGFSMRPGFDEESPQRAAALFGFGKTTGITLPQESPGRLPTREWLSSLCRDYPEDYSDCRWGTGRTLNTAIGQGDVLATPMQIVNAYATFANGGTLYQPNLVRAVVDPFDGTDITTFEPRVLREVYYPDGFRQYIDLGLAGVTTVHVSDKIQGTAYDPFINFPHDSWPVAGKTGTSERQSLNPNELTADTALFAAWGPTYDPRYVAAAVLEEAGFGGTAAAPIIARIFQAIANDAVPTAYNRAELAEQAAALAAEALASAVDGAEDDGGSIDEAAAGGG